jgi:hypothetical protein
MAANSPGLIHPSFVDPTSSWMGFELTTLVVIPTDCTGCCKSIYHTITAMTAPFWITSYHFCLFSFLQNVNKCTIPVQNQQHYKQYILQRKITTAQTAWTTAQNRSDSWWFRMGPSSKLGCIKPGELAAIYRCVSVSILSVSMVFWLF